VRFNISIQYKLTKCTFLVLEFKFLIFDVYYMFRTPRVHPQEEYAYVCDVFEPEVGNRRQTIIC